MLEFIVYVALAIGAFLFYKKKIKPAREKAAAEKAAAEKAAAEKAAAEKAAAEKAAAEKAAAEKAAAEKAAAEKAAEKKVATAIKERFNDEFEKMWANLENDPDSFGDEREKLKERLGLDAKADSPVFDNCFKNEFKAKIYSRSSTAKFIIGSQLKECLALKMEAAYNNRKLREHLVGFVMCANRYEKFTGNYTDYSKLSDEEISNFIAHETTFSDNSAPSIASVIEAISSFIFYFSRYWILNNIFTINTTAKDYDVFVFDFVCSAIFSAYFNDCEYEKGNSKSMMDCIYNNVPVTTRYWFCKNIEYLRIDLTHMMYNRDAAFSAMLNHYGLTRADQVADSNVPRQGQCLAGKFDGRNC